MQVIITPKAKKQYQALPPSEKEKLKKRLLFLEQNPTGGKKLSGELNQLRALKVWPYRIIYYIDSKQSQIYVVTIAHRQGVYK